MAKDDHNGIPAVTQDTSQNPNLFHIGQRVWVRNHEYNVSGGIIDDIDPESGLIGIVVPMTGERYGFRARELKAVK